VKILGFNLESGERGIERDKRGGKEEDEERKKGNRTRGVKEFK
jgi:hypothetical protein